MLELVKYIVEQFAEHKDEIEYLEEEKGNMSRTAERLGVGRSTLWRKLRAESSRTVSNL